ncbi:MAG: glycosyltransferase family 2 protein, partial [Acidimicrobiales bacterium]
MPRTRPGGDEPTDPSAGLSEGASADPTTGLGAGDLAVVIPTVGRWDILERTLGGLRAQSAPGFEVIVVSDGAGPPPSGLTQAGGARFITQRGAGPGAARNRGVSETDRGLVLFLGDDMVPDPGLVGAHLATHGRHPGLDVAVLGRVDWHPEVAGNRLNQWLDTSGTQFDYANIERERARAGSVDYDVGFGRFYSCNVSLKRSLFDSVGGFDESFIFYYEDLDLGWRLSDEGLRLLYAPEALTLHLHAYDWAGIENRFRGIALGEKLMARAHPSFEPFFFQRITAAAPHRSLPQPLSGWAERLIGAASARASERIPSQRPGLIARAQARTDTAYHRRLARPFLQAWSSADEVCELRDYLGDEFRPELLIHHEEEVDREAQGAPNEST